MGEKRRGKEIRREKKHLQLKEGELTKGRNYSSATQRILEDMIGRCQRAVTGVSLSVKKKGEQRMGKFVQIRKLNRRGN